MISQSYFLSLSLSLPYISYVSFFEKSQQILIEEEGGEIIYVPYIGDFGIAAFSKKMTVEGSNLRPVFGLSVSYAAPEVFERLYLTNTAPSDIQIDQKLDVYSFAIVVFETVNLFSQHNLNTILSYPFLLFHPFLSFTMNTMKLADPNPSMGGTQSGRY